MTATTSFFSWSLLFVVIIEQSRTVGHGQCSLITIYGLKTADCMNLNLKSIPQTLDSDLKALNFHDNQLTNLADDRFQVYPSLQNLYLVRNRLAIIAPDAFQGLQNLQILDLEGNKLDVIPFHTFRHLKSLRFLSLKSNPITYITNNDLAGLKNIETLNFENCWLARIEPRAFHDLKKLYELNLVNNELHGLNLEMEESLSKGLTILRLYSNPWQCDCRLRWLRKILHKIPNWEFGPNTPACSGPDLLRGVSWKHLSPEQFACPSVIVVDNTTTSIELKVGSNVTIDCIVFGDPEPNVSWMKGPKFVNPELITESSFVPANSQDRYLRSKVRLRSVTRLDAGDYKCIAFNPAGRSEVTYKVWVTGKDQLLLAVPQSDFRFGFEVVLGVVLGGFLLVGALLAFIVCSVVLRQRSRTQMAEKQKEHAGNSIGESGSKNVRANENGKTKEFHPKEKVLLSLVTEGSSGTLKNSVKVQPRDGDKYEEVNEIVIQTIGKDDRDSTAIPPNHDPLGEDQDDQETIEFKMKIFKRLSEEEIPFEPGSGSPTKDDRKRSFSVSGVGRQVALERSGIHTAKESPPDLLCTRSTTGPRKHDAKLHSSHLERPLPTGDGSQPMTSSAAGPCSATKPSDDAGGDELDCRSKPKNVTPKEGFHCANPVCMKDRYTGHESSTVNRHATETCSHKMAQSTGQSHDLQFSSLRTRHSSNDIARDCDDDVTSRSTSGHDNDARRSPYSHGQHKSDRRPDLYSTLPIRPSQAQKDKIKEVLDSYARRLPVQNTSTVISSRTKTGRKSTAGQELNNTRFDQGGSPSNKQVVSRYRSSISVWSESNHTSGGRSYNLPNQSTRTRLSGSSSTLDVRTSGQTPPLTRKLQATSSTSLHDIISSPFGSCATAGESHKPSLKPGDQYELGTAV